jgi:hypothetical protein
MGNGRAVNIIEQQLAAEALGAKSSAANGLAANAFCHHGCWQCTAIAWGPQLILAANPSFPFLLPFCCHFPMTAPKRAANFSALQSTGNKLSLSSVVASMGACPWDGDDRQIRKYPLRYHCFYWATESLPAQIAASSDGLAALGVFAALGVLTK